MAMTNRGMLAQYESNRSNTYGPVLDANASDIKNDTKQVMPEKDYLSTNPSPHSTDF